MSKKSRHKIIVILGPTSSGKSDLAVKVAKKINGEVVSADSRQVYKGLDIGSGKITKKEMRGIRHHLLDVASPRGLFTVSKYRAMARKAIDDILSRGKTPIVTGGTGLYIDSILYDAPLPEVAPNLKLRARLGKKSTKELFAQLKKLDPARAKNIDKNNPHRLVRALEIVLKTGRPVPALAEHKTMFDTTKIGISLPPDVLKKRIRARLTSRLKQGMLREVKRLHESGVSWKRLDDLGLEYRYASRHLHGLISREDMIQSIESESWKYARRQMTWWRKDKEIAWTSDGKRALALITRQALS